MVIRSTLSGAITRQRHAQISDDDCDVDTLPEDAKQMRVGSAFQAVVPDVPLGSAPAPLDYEADKEVLIWSPSNANAANTGGLADDSISDYLRLAKDKYNYDFEQALGLLNWHNYDVELSLADLPNYTPIPDEWSVEDKVLFEQAYGFHEKQFHKIKQMLPEKSFASLVKYYYSWKKTRSRTSSLMDRQARRFQQQKKDGEGSSSGSRSGSASEEEDEDQDENLDQEGNPSVERCNNCGVAACDEDMSPNQLVNTSKGQLCRVCHDYWKKTGMMRRVPRSDRDRARAKRDRSAAASSGRASAASGTLIGKSLRKRPSGIYLDLEELQELARGTDSQGEVILKALDTELEVAKGAIQEQRQNIEQLRKQLASGVVSPSGGQENEDQTIAKSNGWLSALSIPEQPAKRSINSRWSNDEILIAVQSFRRYGTDFKAIAEVIGNKTETHVKNFYATYKARFKLEDFVNEYRRENGLQQDDDSDS